MVIILRGISGVGKSTLARFLLSDGTNVDKVMNNSETAGFMWHLHDTSPRPRAVFSTDDYFMTKDGEYLFDPRKLVAAHGACLRKFAEAIREPPSDASIQTLVVDNTNCSVTEVAPYAALAAAYSHELHVVTLIGDPTVCWQRGNHGVPFQNVLRQDMNLRKSLVEWPSWYQQQVFPI